MIRYDDHASAEMPMERAPAPITRITLTPRIIVRGGDTTHVEELVSRAPEDCYIANSLSADVVVEPRVEVMS